MQSWLQKGAQVHHADGGGKTALHVAAGAGAREVCKELLDRGADVNARVRDGGTPMDEADYWSVKPIVGDHGEVREKCLATLELLLAHGGKRSIQSERSDGNFINDRRQKLEAMARDRGVEAPWLMERFMDGRTPAELQAQQPGAAVPLASWAPAQAPAQAPVLAPWAAAPQPCVAAPQPWVAPPESRSAGPCGAAPGHGSPWI